MYIQFFFYLNLISPFVSVWLISQIKRIPFADMWIDWSTVPTQIVYFSYMWIYIYIYMYVCVTYLNTLNKHHIYFYFLSWSRINYFLKIIAFFRKYFQLNISRKSIGNSTNFFFFKFSFSLNIRLFFNISCDFKLLRNKIWAKKIRQKNSKYIRKIRRKVK